MKYSRIFEPYSGPTSKHICPKCNDRRKTFVYYLDPVTRQPIDSIVGKCDRENKCGYNYKVSDFLRDRGMPTYSISPKILNRTIVKSLPPSLIPIENVKASFDEGIGNFFRIFLIQKFGQIKSTEVFRKYLIGNSNRWPGATIFWQIDQHKGIRTGKIMLYDQYSGKRVKNLYTPISWVHSELKLANFNLVQCLFGEHLLIDHTKPVAIVESEKTACIASILLPNFIWLATGGKSNLTPERCRVLNGRKVKLFPDLGAFEVWKKFADGHKYSISNYLERIANDEERKEGLDIADYLLKIKPQE